MIRILTTMGLVSFAAFALSITADGQDPAPKVDVQKFAAVKGKLPTGWTTTLKLSAAQKARMYAVSVDFQKKIAEIRHEEYVALYKMLDEHQKAYLKSKIID